MEEALKENTQRHEHAGQGIMEIKDKKYTFTNWWAIKKLQA